MENIKIVVIGPGLIGIKHINLICENANVTLAGIVAPINHKNTLISQNLHVPLFATLESCSNQISIDAVIISSPNQFHFEQAVFCIKNDIPVLVEKPLCDCLSKAKELVLLTKKYNAKVLVGHHRTYSKFALETKKIITDNKLGKMVSFIGSAQFYKPTDYFDIAPWRKSLVGGPILINLIHEIGLMRTWLGEIKSVQAMASSNNRKFIVEDTVSINIEFLSGVLGVFLLSDCAATTKSWEMTTAENSSYPYYSDDSAYHLAGSLGSLSVPNMKLYSYISNEPSWWNKFDYEKVVVPLVDPLKNQLEHFINVINNLETPLVSVFDGYSNLLVIHAIQKAIATGTRIYIRDMDIL